ncbi:MAG: hypothetical protein LKE37_01505 [Atopobiaceae bacterium]|jgi:hypothetical protein|nr:hypothetical protein [Atopobiaceae bacterium]
MAREIHGSEELRDALSRLPIVGRRVVSVDIVGRLLHTDRVTMINCYNNQVRKPDEPFRLTRMPIYEDEIPLAVPRTRLVLSDGPFVFGLDDGSALEIAMPGSSCAIIDFVRNASSRPRNDLVNASGILRPAIGEAVTGIEVMAMSIRDQERGYVEEAYQVDAFKRCLIRCEDHAFEIFWGTCIASTNDELPVPLEMTMGDLRDNISCYSDLVDKRKG